MTRNRPDFRVPRVLTWRGRTAAARLSARAKRAAAVGLDLTRPIFRFRPCFVWYYLHIILWPNSVSWLYSYIMKNLIWIRFITIAKDNYGLCEEYNVNNSLTDFCRRQWKSNGKYFYFGPHSIRTGPNNRIWRIRTRRGPTAAAHLSTCAKKAAAVGFDLTRQI